MLFTDDIEEGLAFFVFDGIEGPLQGRADLGSVYIRPSRNVGPVSTSLYVNTISPLKMAQRLLLA